MMYYLIVFHLDSYVKAVQKVKESLETDNIETEQDDMDRPIR